MPQQCESEMRRRKRDMRKGPKECVQFAPSSLLANKQKGTKCSAPARLRPAGAPELVHFTLVLVICSLAPVPCLHSIPTSQASVDSHSSRSSQAQQGTAEGLQRFQLRGGAGPLKSSAVVNFLTGEAVDEVTVVNVDSDDDMTGAQPVDWLPRGDLLLPEERAKLGYDYGDMSDPEHGEPRSPRSNGGKRSRKVSGFSRWKAKLTARYAAGRARVEEAAAQVVLDVANKYSCGLGEYWARRVLASRRGRRRKEKREAEKLAKSGRMVRISSASPSCLPLHGRTGSAMQFGAEEEEEEEDSVGSSDSSLSYLSSEEEEVEVLQEDDEEEHWEASSEPWLVANVTRPSKEEVALLAVHVAQLAEESGERMLEVMALRRQCERLGKVLAVVGDQAPTDASSSVLASLHAALSRAETLLAFILRPYGISRRWLPLLLPVSSKLLRQVTEMAAEISELLEEGGDGLMDLLPVGVSMIINSGAARASWRKWLGAHAISGSKKKMKYCLAVELSKAHETYNSMHLKLGAVSASSAAASGGGGVQPIPIAVHVVDAAAEVLCQMSLCAQAPDQVDVLAWNLAFPAHVHMVVALEALVTAAHVTAPVFPALKAARAHLYDVAGEGVAGGDQSLSDSVNEEKCERRDGAFVKMTNDIVRADAFEQKDDQDARLRKVRSCGMQLLEAVTMDTNEVHTQADAVMNAVIMEYPLPQTKMCAEEREGLERIGALVAAFECASKRLQYAHAAIGALHRAPDGEAAHDEKEGERGGGREGEREVGRESPSPSKSVREIERERERERGREGNASDDSSELEEHRDVSVSQVPIPIQMHIHTPAHPPASTQSLEDEQRQCIEVQLFKNAHAGNVGVCLYYVLYCGVSLAAHDNRGNTALHLAAAQGHLDLARTLKYLGAPAMAMNHEGLTPGSLASRRGHKAVSSWFSSLSGTSNQDAYNQDTGAADAGAAGSDELHVVVASLTRLAHVKLLHETSTHGVSSTHKNGGGGGINFKLPSGPPGWSTHGSRGAVLEHVQAKGGGGANYSQQEANNVGHSNSAPLGALATGSLAAVVDERDGVSIQSQSQRMARNVKIPQARSAAADSLSTIENWERSGVFEKTHALGRVPHMLRDDALAARPLNISTLTGLTPKQCSSHVKTAQEDTESRSMPSRSATASTLTGLTKSKDTTASSSIFRRARIRRSLSSIEATASGNKSSKWQFNVASILEHPSTSMTTMHNATASHKQRPR